MKFALAISSLLVLVNQTISYPVSPIEHESIASIAGATPDSKFVGVQGTPGTSGLAGAFNPQGGLMQVKPFGFADPFPPFTNADWAQQPPLAKPPGVPPAKPPVVPPTKPPVVAPTKPPVVAPAKPPVVPPTKPPVVAPADPLGVPPVVPPAVQPQPEFVSSFSSATPESKLVSVQGTPGTFGSAGAFNPVGGLMLEKPFGEPSTNPFTFFSN
jgi:hypothetical protein